MAKSFDVEFSDDALDHLDGLRAAERAEVLRSIESNLRYEPASVTRNRKSLRPNDLAPFELRVGKIRVYYRVSVDANSRLVVILAIGIKEGSKVFVGGEEIDL